MKRALLPMLDIGVLAFLLWGFDRLFIAPGPHVIWSFGLETWVVHALVLLGSFGLLGAYDLPVRLSNVVRSGVLVFVDYRSSTVGAEFDDLRVMQW